LKLGEKRAYIINTRLVQSNRISDNTHRRTVKSTI